MARDSAIILRLVRRFTHTRWAPMAWRRRRCFLQLANFQILVSCLTATGGRNGEMREQLDAIDESSRVLVEGIMNRHPYEQHRLASAKARDCEHVCMCVDTKDEDQGLCWSGVHAFLSEGASASTCQPTRASRDTSHIPPTIISRNRTTWHCASLNVVLDLSHHQLTKIREKRSRHTSGLPLSTV